MIDNGLVKINGQTTLAISKDMDKVTRMRVRRFNTFLKETGITVLSVPIQEYSLWLTKSTLSHNSIVVYTNTIRGVYRKMLADNATRQALFDSLPDEMPFIERKARVDEFVLQTVNVLNSVKIKGHKKQDNLATDHIRLTVSQTEQLINSPNTDTLQGLRDTTILALMLASGIREQELCDLEVKDIRVKSEDNELCLYVRSGKGDKSRLIPYGELSWVLVLVDKWLDVSGITSGPVFVSYFRGYKTIRGKLTGRSIQNILKDYPIVIDGKQTKVKPHDLRRSYAKLLHDSGKRLLHISYNLGHSSIETTRGYIGKDDMIKRSPGRVFSYDLAKL